MAARLTTAELNAIVACPLSKQSLRLVEGADAQSPDGKETYPWTRGNWDRVPSACRSSRAWEVWDRLQANGQVSYRNDPEHNLAVGVRSDTAAFAQFCKFDGLVLDVGCGPEPWPAYFQGASARTRYVGVDPLIGPSGPHFLQLRALAEYLPFAAGCFDQVVFATSLDHFVDPAQSLSEARRVCRGGGEVLIWAGERLPGAPRPRVSPDWYLALQTPAGAQDPFHMKRLSPGEVRACCAVCGLEVAERRTLPVDAFRRNHFFRLRAA